MTGHGRRLLIVEDEFLVAFEIEDAALSGGFDVIGIAVDTEEAMRLAPQADIALVDLNLRDGFTGPDIAARLAGDYDVGVILLTANPGLVPDTGAAMEVLAKPCRPKAIIAALVEGALRREGQRESSALGTAIEPQQAQASG